MAAKKKSGRNVAESERNTERVTLRLDPEAMDILRFYAESWSCPMSEVVASALDSLQADKAIGDAMRFKAAVASRDRGSAPENDR